MEARFVLACGVATAIFTLAVSLGLPAVSEAAHANQQPLAREAACTARAAVALVREFVADYNRGRVAAADRLWAPEPRFKWFSSRAPGRRLGHRAYDRATLVSYFRSRVRVHERIRLLELHAGYDPARNIVNFAGKLMRSADDLLPTPFDFKGAAGCQSDSPSLIGWSM